MTSLTSEVNLFKALMLCKASWPLLLKVMTSLSNTMTSLKSNPNDLRDPKDHLVAVPDCPLAFPDPTDPDLKMRRKDKGSLTDQPQKMSILLRDTHTLTKMAASLLVTLAKMEASGKIFSFFCKQTVVKCKHNNLSGKKLVE